MCSTASKASPLRFSASTSPPWKGTQPTSSERSFEPWGCQTPPPRGMSSGLSSTRCVKIQFPRPPAKIKRKKLTVKSCNLCMQKTLLDSGSVKNTYYISWLLVLHHIISGPNWQSEPTTTRLWLQAWVTARPKARELSRPAECLQSWNRVS